MGNSGGGIGGDAATFLDLIGLLQSIDRKLGVLVAEREAPAREWLTWNEAARVAGRSREGARCLVRRAVERGLPVRRQHGRVHAVDFARLMDCETKALPENTTAATVAAARRALESIEL